VGRVVGLGQVLEVESGVHLRRGDVGVAEHRLHRAQIGAVVQKMGRKRVAQKVIGRPWYVLADISEFTAQKPEVSALVEQTMAFALSHGMVKAANLVSSSLGKMQIARLSQAMGLPEFSFFQTERQAIEWLLASAA